MSAHHGTVSGAGSGPADPSQKEEEVIMEKKMIDLHDDYRHGLIDRREFLKRLSVLAGSVAAANALLPLFDANDARAQIVAKDDPRLVTQSVTPFAARLLNNV